MKTILGILAIFALGMMNVSAIDLSNNPQAVAWWSQNVASEPQNGSQFVLGLFDTKPLGYANATTAKAAMYQGTVGGFDYAELNEFNTLQQTGSLIPVGKVANGPGHYQDGVGSYIQN